MNKISVFCIALLVQVAVKAQPVPTSKNSPVTLINNYSILPDRGFFFNQILADSTLRFAANDSLRYRQATSYWVKLIIDNSSSSIRSCQVRIFPGMANRLYYFDANARQWLMEEAGMMPGRDNGRINRRGMACVLRADTINTVYVHINLKHLGAFVTFKPDIRLETNEFANKQEQLIWISWITSLAVIVLFLLNNVYIYFSFKDKAVLYYLIGQLGGLIYMTAHKQLFPAFFPNVVFTAGLQPNGKAAWYGLNDLLLHTGILVVIYSIVQFSRSYLNTRQALPRLDGVLRWGMRGYLLLSFIFVIINTGFYYIEPYAWLMDNALPVFLFVAILYAGVAGYRRRLPAARPFLVANVVSVGCMLAIPLYHLI